ncbi:MAG: hypothetical protein RIQ81_2413 [Pseudomonadota bacterium]
MKDAHYAILKNGIELITLERHFAPVSSIQCWIRAGSIMEGDDPGDHPRGIAHFLEHMTFKGTPRLKVGEISSKIEGWGGEINAYTTFDRTVYYLTVATPFVKDALALLCDAVFESSLDPVEVERERKVILEEISRSLDDPGTRAAQLLFARAYAGSEAGRPVIGSAASVAAITCQQLKAFRDRFYQPQNCGFVVVGDFDESETAAFLEKLPPSFQTSSATQASVRRSHPVWATSPWHAKIGMTRMPMAVDFVRGDYQQVRFDFAVPAPELEHVDTPALDMCAYLLGGGDLGLLNRQLRDEEGVVSSAAATLFSPAFPGLFEISLMTSGEAALAAIEAAGRVLTAFPVQENWSEADLARAKAAVRSEKVFRNETVEGLARVGFGITTAQKHRHEDAWLERVQALEVDDLIEAWNRWISPENFHIVGVVPDAVALQPAEVKEAFLRGVAAGGRDTKNRRSARPVSCQVHQPVFVCELKPGVKFIYRERPGSGLLSLVFATEGGQRAEFGDGPPPGMFSAMAANLARATEVRGFEDCSRLVEGRGADIAAFSGKDSLGFRMSCLIDDHAELSDLLFEMMQRPAFPGQQFASYLREIEDYFRQQADSPSAVCVRKLQRAVLAGHPYGNDISGSWETASLWQPEEVLGSYLRWRDGGPWVIAGCGDLPAGEVSKLLERGLSTFRPNTLARRFPSDAVLPVRTAARHPVAMDRQQVHFATGMPGPGWRSPDRFAVDVLFNILGGTGGRLFRNLRDRESLAYSVAPILSYGTSRGLLGAYIACAPEKVVAAEAGIWGELDAISKDGVLEDELQRAKSYITGNHAMELQSGEAEASTMALMELYGIGHEAFREYYGHIASVSPGDVQEVARRFLDKNLAQTVIVGL